MSIEFGCHGITWTLDYDKEIDFLDEVLDTVSQNGFTTIDIIYATLGKYENDPEALRESLEERNLKLGAITLPFAWVNDEETEEERELADYTIDYLSRFPNTVLNLPIRVQSEDDKDSRVETQKKIVKNANEVAKRADAKGVKACIHPATPGDSYFKTPSDYDVLFKNIDREYLGYTPDTGHILAAGLDPLQVIKENIDIVHHMHFKEANDNLEWDVMGEGTIDFIGIMKLLVENDYNGWVMVEEETPEAPLEPQKTVKHMASYVNKNLMPIVEKN